MDVDPATFLYLRNIVEQEVADGRLAQQHDYRRWTGDPIMPPGLVELIESRTGALPSSVSDVVDVLAVAEPIGQTQAGANRTAGDRCHTPARADRRPRFLGWLGVWA